jgi:hypothetical protein
MAAPWTSGIAALGTGLAIAGFCVAARRNDAYIGRLTENSLRYRPSRSQQDEFADPDRFASWVRSILLFGIGFGAVLIIAGVSVLIAAL